MHGKFECIDCQRCEHSAFVKPKFTSFLTIFFGKSLTTDIETWDGNINYWMCNIDLILEIGKSVGVAIS